MDPLTTMLTAQHPIEVIASEDIHEGEIVYVSALSGGRATVSLASAAAGQQAGHVLFMAHRRTLANQRGYVVPMRFEERAGLTVNVAIYLGDPTGSISESPGTESRQIGWSTAGGFVFTGAI